MCVCNDKLCRKIKDVECEKESEHVTHSGPSRTDNESINESDHEMSTF